MYAIIDKENNQIIDIISSDSFGPIEGKAIYPAFDEKTMKVGWTQMKYIPIHFRLQDNGQIVELNLEEQVDKKLRTLSVMEKLEGGRIVNKTLLELAKEGVVPLSRIKEDMIETFSQLSFEKRQELISDYKLNNAALGVYDEETTKNYRATIQAFRDEFYRLQSAIKKAQTLDELLAITPNFPIEVVKVSNDKQA